MPETGDLARGRQIVVGRVAPCFDPRRSITIIPVPGCNGSRFRQR
jgi:hypothetical protein